MTEKQIPKKEYAMNTMIDEKANELLPVQNEVPNCFVCGQENPRGLKLRFMKESETSLCTEFTPPDYWTGWGRMMHGGFHGLLLDETMSWVAFGLMDVRGFVTKEMTVKYLRPVYVGLKLKVTGRLEEDNGREIRTRAEITDAEGNLLTVAHATLARVDIEKMKKIMS